ncbi:MAG: 23S rRNA (guanosine(2251)-2'-O)-methyltransferase RlmB [bacterium]|nr:23S rRNA (guanosine(2251)-2'-O)-methyltransferase RlmB [bacterium]
MSELIYGKHPILEALRAHRRKIKRICYLQSSQRDEDREEIFHLAQGAGIPLQALGGQELEQLSGGASHQGLVAEVSPLVQVPWKEFLARLEDAGETTLLALDQIQDPQNLGALIRSGEAAGAAGILIPDRHSPPLSPAVNKASAGALEHLPVFRLPNLVRGLEQAKKLGFWIVGTQAKAGRSALDFDWPAKTVLVLGAEDAGLRRLTSEACDFLIQLPLPGKIFSLNVAQAATACLFLRMQAGRKKNP